MLLMRGASSSAIIVSKNGERFHAEDCHYDTAGKIGTEQPGCMAYMIFDTAARDTYEIFEDSFVSKLVVEGANVDELASTIGASGLADAVVHYNDMAEQGVDGDFGSPIEGLFACGEVCVSSEVREGLLYSSGIAPGTACVPVGKGLLAPAFRLLPLRGRFQAPTPCSSIRALDLPFYCLNGFLFYL